MRGHGDPCRKIGNRRRGALDRPQRLFRRPAV